LRSSTTRGTVDRDKREASGAGNNPYEYEAIAPSELVQGVVGDVQRGAQRRVQPRPAARRRVPDGDTEPVQISVDSDDEDEKRSDEADEADDGEEDGTKSDR